MQKKILLHVIAILGMFGCTRRISRPPIRGYIYDSITKEKLSNVFLQTWSNGAGKYVTETNTDSSGLFTLSMLTYYDKFAIGSEAPEERYDFIIHKDGYIQKHINKKAKFGFVRDTVFYSIYLIKINESPYESGNGF